MIAEKLRRAVARRAWRRRKQLWQLLYGTAGEARPVFLVGCQRSGTNMLQEAIDRSLQTWIYNEDNSTAFDNYRIQPLAKRKRLIARARCRWVLFKPLCDTQNIDRLMAEHPGSRVIWPFRHYDDVVNSTLRAFGRGRQLWMVRMAATEPAWDHWFVERMSGSTRALLARHYRSGLSVYSAAALKWYVRNQIFFEYGLDDHPDVRLAEYEQLVRRPEQEIGAVLAELGLDFDPQWTANVHKGSVAREAPPPIDDEIRTLCDQLLEQLREVESRRPSGCRRESNERDLHAPAASLLNP